MAQGAKMTHDELLACLKPEYAYGKIGDALRAVVQLHRPKDFARDTDWPWVGCMECEEQYPCDTIQDIEKELG